MMSELEEIKNELNEARNKLILLETEEKSIISDTYFYQKKNDLDKLDELSLKQEDLSKKISSQKLLIDKLESKLNSAKSQIEESEIQQKNKLKEEQEKIAREKEKEEIKKQEDKTSSHEKNERIKRNAEKFKKEDEKRKKQKINNLKHEIGKNKTQVTKGFKIQKNCPQCGTIIENKAVFCPTCGHQLKNVPVKKNNGNWFVRLIFKKKKDDGAYRFSISKSLGFVYALIEFLSAIGTYYFPESIIIGIIVALIGYGIFCGCGYLVRWAYNKFLK